MFEINRILLPALFTLLLMCCMQPAGATSSLPVPSGKDKCPVCGMFVSKYPDWLGTIVFKNSPAVFFDGPKDLFSYYLKIRNNDGHKLITAIMVKDYYTLKHIEARKAHFVVGSNILGPMGKELVPFEKPAAAKEFLKDHKGKRIISFNEINAALLKSLE